MDWAQENKQLGGLVEGLMKQHPGASQWLESRRELGRAGMLPPLPEPPPAPPEPSAPTRNVTPTAQPAPASTPPPVVDLSGPKYGKFFDTLLGAMKSNAELDRLTRKYLDQPLSMIGGGTLSNACFEVIQSCKSNGGVEALATGLVQSHPESRGALVSAGIIGPDFAPAEAAPAAPSKPVDPKDLHMPAIVDLSGRQSVDLSDALARICDTKENLNRLTLAGLNTRIDMLAGSSQPLQDQVLAVLQHCQSNGQLAGFLTTAVEKFPAFATDLRQAGVA